MREKETERWIETENEHENWRGGGENERAKGREKTDQYWKLLKPAVKCGRRTTGYTLTHSIVRHTPK